MGEWKALRVQILREFRVSQKAPRQVAWAAPGRATTQHPGMSFIPQSLWMAPSRVGQWGASASGKTAVSWGICSHFCKHLRRRGTVKPLVCQLQSHFYRGLDDPSWLCILHSPLPQTNQCKAVDLWKRWIEWVRGETGKKAEKRVKKNNKVGSGKEGGEGGKSRSVGKGTAASRSAF